MIAISNAGATMPVMSSSLSQEMTINAAIPANINAQSAMAEYFTAFNKSVSSIRPQRSVYPPYLLAMIAPKAMCSRPKLAPIIIFP